MYSLNCIQIMGYFKIFLNTQSITIISKKSSTLNILSIELFFLKFNTTSNKKLKFSGKGYKIVKRWLNLRLHLNTSHNQWVFFFKTIVIKNQKQKFIFLNKNAEQLIKLVVNIVKIKFINIFTKRGLRLSKQKILKKIGKRST